MSYKGKYRPNNPLKYKGDYRNIIAAENYESSIKVVEKQDKPPVEKKITEKVNNKRSNFVYYGNVSSSNNGQLLPI